MTNYMLTPSELAKRWRVSASKVLGFIHRGELKALNIAARPGGRPRFRINPADIAAFENRRSVHTVARSPPRKRKAASGVIDFF
jgi:hypothetical protein